MKPSILILFLFVSGSLYSQHRTYYSLEAGLTSPGLLDIDIPEISSRRIFYPSPKLGFSLRKEIGRTFSLEAGVNKVVISNAFQAGKLIVYIDNEDMFVFPLKLNMSKRLVSERLFMFTSVGAQYFYTFTSSGGGSKPSLFTRESLIVEDWSTSGNHVQVIGTIGLRYKLVDELLLTISAGYAHGFRSVKNYKLTYLDFETVIAETQAESRENYCDITIGFSYPLGRGFKLLGSAYNEMLER